MENKLIKAVIIETGKRVQVYRSSERGTFIDYSDCSTEYEESQLNITKT